MVEVLESCVRVSLGFIHLQEILEGRENGFHPHLDRREPGDPFGREWQAPGEVAFPDTDLGLNQFECGEEYRVAEDLAEADLVGRDSPPFFFG